MKRAASGPKVRKAACLVKTSLALECYIVDLFILLAKYRIFHAKANNCNPLTSVFLRTARQRLGVGNQNTVKNYSTVLLLQRMGIVQSIFLYNIFLLRLILCHILAIV